MRYTLHILLCSLALSPLWAKDPSAQPKDNYWQCLTVDKDHKEWTSENTFKRMAMYKAFDACKKESPSPMTCKTSKDACHYIRQTPNGVQDSVFSSNTAVWRCTALDKAAKAWIGNPSSNQDEAALGAKTSCESQSTLPDTCYVNLLTCLNINQLQGA